MPDYTVYLRVTARVENADNGMDAQERAERILSKTFHAPLHGGVSLSVSSAVADDAWEHRPAATREA